MRVSIWLDDIRDPKDPIWWGIIHKVAPNTEEVVWVKDVTSFVETFIKVYANPDLELVATFFDNDLGPGLHEGVHAFNWLERFVRRHKLAEFKLYAQTSNPAAKKTMELGFAALERYWYDQEES